MEDEYDLSGFYKHLCSLKCGLLASIDQVSQESISVQRDNQYFLSILY